MIDATHDANRRSWVESANGHPEFPIQNLPFAIFSSPEEGPRGGVAIGDEIFDLAAANAARLFSGGAAAAAEAASATHLNALFALGTPSRTALRARLSGILAADSPGRRDAETLRERLLHKAADCTLHVP